MQQPSLPPDALSSAVATNAFAFLSEASKVLGGSLDYEATLRNVAQLAVPRIADWCGVDLVTEAGTLRRVAVAHVDPEKVQLAHELERRYPTDPRATTGVWQVLRTGKAELYAEIPDALLEQSAVDDEHLRLIRALRLQSVMIVPLQARGLTLGVLTLVWAESGRRYDTNDLMLAEDLAGRAALAVDNAWLYRRAQDELQERERAQTAQRASQAELDVARRVLEDKAIYEATALNLVDGLAICDPQDRIICWNPRLEELFGIPSTEALGRRIQEVATAIHVRTANFEAVSRRSQAAYAAAMQGTPTQFEYRLDGEPPLDLSVLIFPIAGADGSLGHGRLVRDVTREREVERLKDDLVSVVSHELRTPLAALVGFAELLLTRDYPDAQRRQFLGVMLREGRRLTALINDFLDLQRMESGGQEVQPRPADPHSILERAAAAAGEDPLRPIRIEALERLPTILADEDRILQVLTNLISNARKYSPAGGEVRLSGQEVDGYLEIVVQDQGLGIPPEALPRLFQKFYRVDNSDRRQITGTGLGLAIARKIVEGHAGRIWAESDGLGQGSAFHLRLPIADVPREPPSPSPAASPRVARELEVLVVEDNAAYAHWLEETLRGEGYRVRVVGSAETALEAIRLARPGAMLLDLRLGGQMDGWDLLAVLRGRAETSDLPVVVVSAFDERTSPQALGVDSYLIKPVRQDRLLSTLHRLALPEGRAVLVVEDDPATRQYIQQVLQREGFRVRTVGSGEEALAVLEAESDAYGALTLDLGLPGIDGFEVLDSLRSRPSTRHVPVVIFSGRDLTDTEKLRLTEQAQEIVRKGNGVPIVEAVARALGRAPVGGAQPHAPS